jgi:hypothetical protein
VESERAVKTSLDHFFFVINHVEFFEFGMDNADHSHNAGSNLDWPDIE